MSDKTLKARIRFTKTGLSRFIGHLDLMRYFQKAIRRALIPIAYSEGFHPHQILSFAMPLSTGTTSEGEYLDLELTERIEPDEAVLKLNEQMAEGIFVLSFTYLPEGTKKAMSEVAAAKYYVYLKEKGISLPKTEHIYAGIKSFYSDADSIIITKKTKKGERQLDLKPLVYSFIPVSEAGLIPELISDEAVGHPGFFVMLSAGSVDNIKPELLFSYFLSSVGIKEGQYSLGIHRLDLYLKKDDEFISLSQKL